MWKNYLKVAVRNSYKDKYYIVINVLGMGVAMAFGLTIYLFYAYNLEFDSYYEDTESIARLHCLKTEPSGETNRFELAPIPMAATAASELAGIEDYTRYMNWHDNLKYQDQIFNQSIAYADPNFFQFFPMKLNNGHVSSKLEPNTIYLTEELATKYFGKTDPIGETMTIYYGAEKFVDFEVVGVFDRIPLNSSFIFEAIVAFDHFLYGQDINPDDWSPWQQASVFFQLSNPTLVDQVNESINKFVAIQNEAREEWKVSNYNVVGFKEAEFLSQGVLEGAQANLRLRPEVLIVFTVLAVLILLIVSFNLANTAMALMARRFKEIGVRKVMGSGSMHIFTQYMFEMSWTSFLGLISGIALFHWVSQGFFAIWDIPYETGDVSFIRLVMAFIGLFVLTALVSGLSPSFYSKKLNPTSIFQKQVKMKQTNMVSQILISFQFAISLTLIIAGVVFTQNADFLRMLDMGYEKDRIMTIRVDSEAEFNGLKNKIAIYSAITDLGFTKNHIGWSYEDSYLVSDTGKMEIKSMFVGRNYLDMLELKVLEGRLFDFDKSSDLQENVIVNQTYVDKFSLQEPIGKIVNLEGSKKYIVGVVNNTIDHVYQDFEAEPKIYLASKDEECKILVIKTDNDKKDQVIAFMEETWKKIIPNRPFSGRFQDDMVMNYALQDNNNLRTIFFYMAILGGILSITGIFALSSLNVSRRIKEIGIRKVMGASSQKIILLMNKEFAITLLSAVILGSILGVLLTNQLLGFIYKFHISISAPTIAFSILIIIAAAFTTTSSTIYSTANRNPSETLRDE